MDYQTYKILHIAFALFAASFTGVSFLAASGQKWVKIAGGVVSLLILVTGFGILAKLGFHGEQWPLWVKLKIGIWVLIAVLGPVLAKRLTRYRGLAYAGLMFLFVSAAALAIWKV